MADNEENEIPPVKKSKFSSSEDEEDTNSVEAKVTDSGDGEGSTGNRNDEVVLEQVQEQNGFQGVAARVPPEVWDIIFTYLGSPKEAHKVMNTCCFWRNVMTPKTMKILFPLVLPLLTPYLSPATILNLRRTCKSWRNSIDSILQSYATSPEKFECHWWYNESPLERVMKFIEYPYLFHIPVDVQEFAEKLPSSTLKQNPFISRGIAIKFESNSEFRTSHATGLNFLQQYGQYVWDFTHFCPNMGGAEDLAVHLLPSLLSQLPNLKSLKVDWISDGVLRIPQETVDFLSNSEANPFPPLPQLTHVNFDFRGGADLEATLGIALLRCYGKQLETLVCRGEFLENAVVTPELIRSLMPNLKNLRIFCVTSVSLQKLSQLQGLPLERLQLWYSFQGMQYKSIIKAINAFAPTLIQLHMDVKLTYPFQECNPLPNSSSTETEDFLGELEDIQMTFPKLVKLSAPVSSINSPFFWKLVKVKFQGLKRLDLQTAMEALFAPYEKKYLRREIEQSKQLFVCLPRLDRIRFWFHNQGTLVVRR